ncbi:Uncharacterised protein [Chryseobacterium gleum]|uniref:Uncharacterized protein n=1 Tax=Chryseobacterium gleum TaxID=250 RepID=A0A3S4N417_CHRGE|nr:Uncharacterised protein [Chryseobacterium gleum]
MISAFFILNYLCRIFLSTRDFISNAIYYCVFYAIYFCTDFADSTDLYDITFILLLLKIFDFLALKTASYSKTLRPCVFQQN